jgi:hypothetical protein
MTINIQLCNSNDGALDTRILRLPEGSDVEAALAEALTTLVSHTWVLAVGDVIKITEV